MAFLYSPYFFGALALLFGCFLNSHFRKDPAFVLNAVFWSLAIISTILTICVHIPKFGVRPFIHIVNPWALIVLATLTYQVFCYPITIENDRFDFYSSDYQENGIIYSHDSEFLNIEDLIKSKYKVNVKMIDGKKTLILPNTFRGETIDYVDIITVPDDIECVVLPKNVMYATLKVNEATFKEVYCYGVYEEKYHESVRTTNISVLNKNGSGLEGLNFTCYYEITEPFVGGFQGNPNINIVQKDSRFY